MIVESVLVGISNYMRVCTSSYRACARDWGFEASRQASRCARVTSHAECSLLQGVYAIHGFNTLSKLKNTLVQSVVTSGDAGQRVILKGVQRTQECLVSD